MTLIPNLVAEGHRVLKNLKNSGDKIPAKDEYKSNYQEPSKEIYGRPSLPGPGARNVFDEGLHVCMFIFDYQNIYTNFCFLKMTKNNSLPLIFELLQIPSVEESQHHTRIFETPISRTVCSA